MFPVSCGTTPAAFGIDVYWKSTGDLVAGKSAAKDSRSLPVLAAILNFALLATL
jgi:hypothetical protein